jgi:hypothetical protein
MASTRRSETGELAPEPTVEAAVDVAANLEPDGTDDVAPARRSRTPRFDPTSIDLTDVDLVRAVRQATAVGGSLPARAVDLAKDATYVTVGLSLLTFQRAQVRRRELERALRR